MKFQVGDMLIANATDVPYYQIACVLSIDLDGIVVKPLKGNPFGKYWRLKTEDAEMIYREPYEDEIRFLRLLIV